MARRPPELPRLWLVSDARNDARLEQSLAQLPRGSGFIFRHYHLDPGARQARFRALNRVAARYGHIVVLAGSARLARRWGAAGAYGGAALLARGPALLRLCSAHDLREIGRAARADAILLSPAFATASHPDARPLGVQRFCALARRAPVPVIALGGMNRHQARRLGGARWAAIDGLSAGHG